MISADRIPMKFLSGEYFLGDPDREGEAALIQHIVSAGYALEG
jgi:hypothetical protein